jgi:hypothetical protein
VGCGTLEVRPPRVRDTEGAFRSQFLPRYQRSSAAIRALLPELYLQGLATGDFEPALRALLGEAAPLSPASIVRLKTQWQAEYEAWRRRPLEPRYAYCWADGLYLKAGPGDEKTAVLIVIGVTADGQKELLAMVEGYRESRESWRDVLRDLHRRGLKMVCLFIGDGGLGLWAAVDEVYPEARHQLCWCQKKLKLLEKKPNGCSRQRSRCSATSMRRQPAARRRRAFVGLPTTLSGTTRGPWRRSWIIRMRYSPTTTFRENTGRACGRRTRSSRSSTRCGCGPERHDGCGTHRQGSTWSFNWCAGPNSAGGESMRPTW